MPSQFGDLFVQTDLEAAVRETLRAWFPTYLAELQRQHPVPVPLALPASIVTHRLDSRWPEEPLPSIVVQVPGTTSVERRSGGVYDAWFAVMVSCLVHAPTLDDTLRLSAYYSAAARAIILQKPALNGMAAGSQWLEERHDSILNGMGDRQRSFQMSALVMNVLVQGIVDGSMGINEPFPDPDVPAPYDYGDGPTAETIIVAADVEPLIDPDTHLPT